MAIIERTDALPDITGTRHSPLRGSERLAFRSRATPSTAATGWIALASRPPLSQGHYLVALRGQRQRIMEYDATAQTFTPRSLAPMVTHWMPLPAPPA